MKANMDIFPVFALRANNHYLFISYYWTCKNKHIATKYVIKGFTT
jgi:hypothetical protein